MTVLADPIAEACRIIEAGRDAGVSIRAVGGVGVALVAPTIARIEPRRTYHDIDLAAPAGTPAVARTMTSLGYEPARRFNTLNGSERLLFHDADGRRVDVFLDALRMCHVLPLEGRLDLVAWPSTLSPADLLLSKLQIVELTDRDAQDIQALLADHDLSDADGEGIELTRIRDVCGREWGWWRTVDDNLATLVARWSDATTTIDPSAAGVLSTACDRALSLRETLKACPKSIGWRVRAAVGARLRWYEEPEEVRQA